MLLMLFPWDITSANDTSASKGECDRKILAELNALVPEGRREKWIDSWYEVSLD